MQTQTADTFYDGISANCPVTNCVLKRKVIDYWAVYNAGTLSGLVATAAGTLTASGSYSPKQQWIQLKFTCAAPPPAAPAASPSPVDSSLIYVIETGPGDWSVAGYENRICKSKISVATPAYNFVECLGAIKTELTGCNTGYIYYGN